MLKNGEFVKIEYDAYDENGNLFDSTRGEIAKALHKKEGPLLVVIGKHRLIKGLDIAIRSMSQGEETEFEFNEANAFGKRSKEYTKIMRTEDFARYNVAPQPGLTVHLDTEQGRIYGTIKSVSGGRVLVDFNHPLSGQKVRYKVKITEVITSPEDRLRAIGEDIGVLSSVSLKDGTATFEIQKDDSFEEKKAVIMVMTKSFMPEIKKIEVLEAKPPSKKA